MDQIRILGIETSTPVCSIALSCNEQVLVEHTLELGTHHSERLQPLIERALQDAGLSLTDLDGVAVAAGPGSFTGLRIGMGLAKGLCLGTGLKFMRISTLECMALGAGAEGIPICPMLDARREEVYAGVYEIVEALPVVKIPDRADSVTNWVKDLPRPVLMVGDGAWAYRQIVLDTLGSDAYFISSSLGRPCAGAVALLGRAYFERGDIDDVNVAEPFYLRRTQAERVRDERLKAAQEV